MQAQLTLIASTAEEMNQLNAIIELVANTSASGLIKTVTVAPALEAEVTKKKKVKAVEADEEEKPKAKKKKPAPVEVEEEEDEDETDEDEDEETDDDEDEDEDEGDDDTEEDDEDEDEEEEDSKPAPKKPGRPKGSSKKDVAPSVKEKSKKDKGIKQNDLIEAFTALVKAKGRGKAKKALEKLGHVNVRDIKEKDYQRAMDIFTK